MSESFPELLGYLEARRSVPALQMSEPGPSSDELKRILKIAARVPDHGKLAPWRFIVVAGDAREELADVLDALRRKAEPDVTEERLAKDRAVLLSSPLHVAVVSRAVGIVAWICVFVIDEVVNGVAPTPPGPSGSNSTVVTPLKKFEPVICRFTADVGLAVTEDGDSGLPVALNWGAG